jgi:hypothetical protein
LNIGGLKYSDIQVCGFRECGFAHAINSVFQILGDTHRRNDYVVVGLFQ